MPRNLLVIAVTALSAQAALASPGESLLATWPPSENYNGRLWHSRPLVANGPAAYDTGTPGAEAYGAWGEEDQQVFVKVGHSVVAISPWHALTLDGLQRFEHARAQWLRERGYTGGVRTFRNTRWEAEAETETVDADPAVQAGVPQPRATIQIPEGARRKPGFRVDSGQREKLAAARLAALKAGGGKVRISLPMIVPASARALAEANGGCLVNETAVAQK